MSLTLELRPLACPPLWGNIVCPACSASSSFFLLLLDVKVVLSLGSLIWVLLQCGPWKMPTYGLALRLEMPVLDSLLSLMRISDTRCFFTSNHL